MNKFMPTNGEKNNKQSNKTENLIAYIILKLSGKITKTQLVKLLYLIDLETFKHTGKLLTDFSWQYHHYGPWDKNFDSKINGLIEKRLIEEKKFQKNKNKSESYYIYNFLPNQLIIHFSPEQKDIIDTIISQFGTITLDSLLKYAYDTEPMKNGKKGEYINFEKDYQKEKNEIEEAKTEVL